MGSCPKLRIYLVVKLCGVVNVLLNSEGMYRRPTQPALLVRKQILITLPVRMLSNKCIDIIPDALHVTYLTSSGDHDSPSRYAALYFRGPFSELSLQEITRSSQSDSLGIVPCAIGLGKKWQSWAFALIIS